MTPPVAAPDLLAFADRKADGMYPVTAEDGRVLAQITARRTGSSFEATDGTGAALCAGKHRSMLSRSWDALDPAGSTILELRDGWGSRKTVTLPDGTEWSLRGRVFGRDFAVTDEHGEPALAAQPDAASRFLHPDGFVVQKYTDRLSFAQVVALVELNRLMIKRARSATSAGGAAASG